MKLLFFLLVLLKNGVNPAEGLKVIYSLRNITLSYSFHLNYNGFVRFCCKLVQRQCFLVVNSRGITELSVERVYFRNDYGIFEAIITNVRETDAGRYRCGVYGLPQTFEEIHITSSDLSQVITPPLPKSSIKPAVWTSSPSTPSVTEKETETSSEGWRTPLTLTAVLAALLLAVISMTLIVCCLKSKKRKSDDCGTFPNTSLEQNGVVYSMVDFKPHQHSSEYVNLQIHRPEDTKEESVEYSTILRTTA